MCEAWPSDIFALAISTRLIWPAPQGHSQPSAVGIFSTPDDLSPARSQRSSTAAIFRSFHLRLNFFCAERIAHPNTTVKGTRPRSADPTRDAQLTYELQTSAKEMLNW